MYFFLFPECSIQYHNQNITKSLQFFGQGLLLCQGHINFARYFINYTIKTLQRAVNLRPRPSSVSKHKQYQISLRAHIVAVTPQISLRAHIVAVTPQISLRAHIVAVTRNPSMSPGVSAKVFIRRCHVKI